MLGVLKCNIFEITDDDPATNILSRNPESGLLIVGLGGSANTYPGLYSLTRNNSVNVIMAGASVSSVTCNASSITINKNDKGRATVVWIPIQN